MRAPAAAARRRATRPTTSASRRWPRCIRRFPHTPVNIEIKGRDGRRRSSVLPRRRPPRRPLNAHPRSDLIVVSFNQKAVDRFHAAAPEIGVAPGIDGTASFLLSNGVARPRHRRLPDPDHLRARRPDDATSPRPDNVARAHHDGYAVARVAQRRRREPGDLGLTARHGRRRRDDGQAEAVRGAAAPARPRAQGCTASRRRADARSVGAR